MTTMTRAHQLFSANTHNLGVGLSLLGFAPLARAGHMGGDFGFVICLGIVPFVALPLLALPALLFGKAPLQRRALPFAVLLLAMMIVLALIGSHAVDFPWYLAPLGWIAPMASWAGVRRCLRPAPRPLPPSRPS